MKVLGKTDPCSRVHFKQEGVRNYNKKKKKLKFSNKFRGDWIMWNMWGR